MQIRKIEGKKPAGWNEAAGHPLQSWEWGEFREQTGVKVVRYGIYEGNSLVEPVTITIHRLPRTGWTVGYYPKGDKPSKELEEILNEVAKENKAIMIKCEPKVEEKEAEKLGSKWVRGRSLFTKYNFELDTSKSEEELLKGMKQKTRYNIKLAERKGVEVEVDNSSQAFERYLELTEETTKRQGFYAHTPTYHRQMWEVLSKAGMAELLTARYEGKIITTWILFRHNETLYYPYGASTREHRNLMANNLVMWEAIKLAKDWGLKKLDMWGALSPTPEPKDPWYGFHKFKEGYGARHVTYTGTWDYVAHPLLYYLYRAAEAVRWQYLRAKNQN